MKQEDSPHFGQPKVIVKRRLVNCKKEYLVEDKDSKLSWRKQGRSIMHEAQKYDEAHKDFLPHFPCLFEITNPKIRIYSENKRLQITYNDKPVTIDSDLSKKARMEILKEFNIMFPVQLFESMYHQGLEKKRVQNLIQENGDE